MADFPPITSGDINKVPLSTDSSGEYKAFLDSIIFKSLANTKGLGFFVDQGGELEETRLFSAEEQLQSFNGAGILEGMEISINASDSTKIDIAAGRFATVSGVTQNIVTYPGATAVTITNPTNKGQLVIDIDANSNIRFRETIDNNRFYCYLGKVRVDGATTPLDVFNTGDRISQNLTTLAQYVNEIGLWYNHLDFKRNATNGFATSGGRIYGYSIPRPISVNSEDPLEIIPMNFAGAKDPAKTTFTIADFKQYFPTNGSTQTISAPTQYVVWTVYVDTNKNFLLFKPQAVTNASGIFAQGEILNAIESNIKPKVITDTSTIVSCIVCNGADNNLDSLVILPLKNKLSQGVGYTQQGGAIPLPVGLRSATEPLGTTELSTSGTAYARKSGIQGINPANKTNNIAFALDKQIDTAAYVRTSTAPIYFVTLSEKDAYQLRLNPQTITNIPNFPALPAAQDVDALATYVTGTGAFNNIPLRDWDKNSQASQTIANAIPNGTDLWGASSQYHILMSTGTTIDRPPIEDQLEAFLEGTPDIRPLWKKYLEFFNQPKFDAFFANRKITPPRDWFMGYQERGFVYSPEVQYTARNRAKVGGFISRSKLANGLPPEDAVKVQNIGWLGIDRTPTGTLYDDRAAKDSTKIRFIDNLITLSNLGTTQQALPLIRFGFPRPPVFLIFIPK